jgi:hypothetical protein
MSDTEALPMEHVEPEGFLQPRRYKHSFRCTRCGHEYSRVSTKVNIPDVPCPKIKCKVAIEVEAKMLADERLAIMLEEQRAPGQLVKGPMTKVIDQTSEMVMKDYGLTNLNDNMREGDIAAPKLPPAQQRAADSFFSGAEVARAAGGARLQAKVNAMGRQAIAGAYRSSAINPGAMQTRAGITPGANPLRMVRKEKA